MAVLSKAPVQHAGSRDHEELFTLDIDDFLFDDLVARSDAARAELVARNEAARAESYLTDEAGDDFEEIEIIETDEAGFTLVTEDVATTDEAPVVVDIIHLVRPNGVFLGLVNALGITDDEARLYLCDAMREAGTSPDAITPEDLWFMLPRIETEVIERYADQDASVRREALHELLRRLRYPR